jgi:predicted ester cyclase
MTLSDADTRSEAVALLVRSLDAMATGSREQFERSYDAAAVNREAATEPPAARQPGPAGFWATAQWLRAAFSGLRWEVHEATGDAGLMALHVTMSGRHTGNFVTYQPGTSVVDAIMPPTGKTFAVTQTHWFRTRDGMITEHWANRDDLDMARQAGWVPPTPAFLLRAAVAKRRAGKRSA